MACLNLTKTNKQKEFIELHMYGRLRLGKLKIFFCLNLSLEFKAGKIKNTINCVKPQLVAHLDFQTL